MITAFEMVVVPDFASVGVLDFFPKNSIFMLADKA